MAKVFGVYLCLFVCSQSVLCQYGLYVPREPRNDRPVLGILGGARERLREGISGLFNSRRRHDRLTTTPAFIPNTPVYEDPHYGGLVVFPDNSQLGNPAINFEQPQGYPNNGAVNFGDQTQPMNPVPTYQDNGGLVYVDKGNQGYGQPNTVFSQNEGNEVLPTESGHVNEVNGMFDNRNSGAGQQNTEAVPDNDPVNFEEDGLNAVSSTERPITTTPVPPTTAPVPPTTTPVPPTTTPVPPTTTLAPLTPVPDTQSRNGGDSGSSVVFMETCQTIDAGAGNCINVFQCPQYVALLQESKTNPAAIQVLRRAHCGFEGSNPKVCCPLPGFSTSPPQPVSTSTTIKPVPTTTSTTSAPNPSSKTSSEDLVPALPEPPHCGVSNASFTRVVGGVDAKLGDFPWMALLGYNNKRLGGTSWSCGGSLISSKHVLTASHCIHNHEVDLYVVRLGELDTSRDDDGATPVDVLIKKKIKHELYDPKAYTNDIAILVLERDVQFTDLIKPICIPKESELRAKSFEDFNPIIAGWGQTGFRGAQTNHLQVVQLPVVSNEFCANAYRQYKAQVIDERTLCAGFKAGGKDACKGDSGGPLMQPIWSKQTYKTYFYQIGVVSYGKGCAEAGFPGVYSRVTHFVPWILQTVVGHA